MPWLDTCVITMESLQLMLPQSLLELVRDVSALVKAAAKINERDAWLIGAEPRVNRRPELRTKPGMPLT